VCSIHSVASVIPSPTSRARSSGGVVKAMRTAGRRAISCVLTWLLVLVSRNLHSSSLELSKANKTYAFFSSVTGK